MNNEPIILTTDEMYIKMMARLYYLNIIVSKCPTCLDGLEKVKNEYEENLKSRINEYRQASL